MKTIELTLTPKQSAYKKQLIKRFHILLGQLGLGNDAKEGILSGYGVEHTTELNIGQLTSAICALEAQSGVSSRNYISQKPEGAEMNKLRKRLIAAIFAWGKAMSLHQLDIEKVKKIAARAAKRDSFNKIPRERLNSLCAAFNKKKRDLSNVEQITTDIIDYLTTNN